MSAERTRGRHDLRRPRRHQRHHRESGRGPCVRSSDRRGRDLHLRGNRRTRGLRVSYEGACGAAELGDAVVECVAKAARYCSILGHGSFAVGNADGGLTAGRNVARRVACKAGRRQSRASSSRAIFRADRRPVSARRGAGRRKPRFGFPNISDNAEIGELIACGAHVILFTTGRGSVVGSAISPVIKVCANPATYRNLSGDMDVDAGRILEGRGTLDEVGREVFEQTVAVSQGAASKSEMLGHQEFILTYKTFEPVGPRACRRAWRRRVVLLRSSRSNATQ